jgi:hypothetical protein
MTNNKLPELNASEFGLGQLPVPMPSSLELALGWHSSARYFGGWWEPAGDELALSDGQHTHVGADWYGWKLFTEHHWVAPHIVNLDLGDTDSAARQSLLFDRELRTVWVADRENADQWLKAQWPVAEQPPRPVHMTPEELLRAVRAHLAKRQAISAADIQARRARAHEAHEQLKRELDAWRPGTT